MNIKLTNLAVHYLKQLISTPGWAATPAHIVLGGGIEARLPDHDSEALADTTDRVYDLSIPEIEVCRVAVKHGFTRLPVNRHSAQLISALEIS